ncbi:hypothetical protein L596_026908 [Steinernema carpocapsae]|uniref:Uncharacterized protein n=1 Tax=Steinernema carpocapsae TaxID=34508 RepID=A0A4U5M3P2_STECR|nr:hypothetical protein L596_026908 [Steinernema carpocapsae]
MCLKCAVMCVKYAVMCLQCAATCLKCAIMCLKCSVNSRGDLKGSDFEPTIGAEQRKGIGDFHPERI